MTTEDDLKPIIAALMVIPGTSEHQTVLIDAARRLLQVASALSTAQAPTVPEPAAVASYTPEIQAILSKPTVTAKEFAKVMGMGINQVYAAIRENRVESLHLGARILIPRRALMDLLEGRSTHEP